MRNFYGRLPFSKGKTNGTYAEINEDDYDPYGPWKNHDLDPAKSYQSTYNEKTGVGYQSCGASRLIQKESEYKMEIKSGQSYLVSTGYKMYESSRDDTVDTEKDGDPFEFIFIYSDSAEDRGNGMIVGLSALLTGLYILII